MEGMRMASHMIALTGDATRITGRCRSMADLEDAYFDQYARTRSHVLPLVSAWALIGLTVVTIGLWPYLT